jgi:predicted acylesterase/phospholipase RssA
MWKPLALVSLFLPSRSVGSSVIALICLLHLTGCQTAQQKTRKPAPSVADEIPTAPARTEPNSKTNEPVSPTFAPAMSKQVGIILGGGGVRTATHIGVLRALQMAGIPIKGIVGLEWSSLVGGLIAANGKPNEAEWKFFKLKKESLPQKSVITGNFETASVDRIFPFLDSSFGGQRMESMKIPFACPTLLLEKPDRLMIRKGLARDAVSFCLPYPPFYKSQKGYYGSMRDLALASKWLREQGANLIVYIEIKSDSKVSGLSQFGEADSARLLWAQNDLDASLELKTVDVHFPISVGSVSAIELESARGLVALGAAQGAKLSNVIKSKD